MFEKKGEKYQKNNVAFFSSFGKSGVVQFAWLNDAATVGDKDEWYVIHGFGSKAQENGICDQIRQ